MHSLQPSCWQIGRLWWRTHPRLILWGRVAKCTNDRQDKDYKVEILKQRKFGGEKLVFVLWKNMPKKFNSWVKSADIKNTLKSAHARMLDKDFFFVCALLTLTTGLRHLRIFNIDTLNFRGTVWWGFKEQGNWWETPFCKRRQWWWSLKVHMWSNAELLPKVNGTLTDSAVPAIKLFLLIHHHAFGHSVKTCGDEKPRVYKFQFIMGFLKTEDLTPSHKNPLWWCIFFQYAL